MDDDDIQEYARPCSNCEYHKQRAQRWREEAYRQAGHPLPERDEPWSPVSIGVDVTKEGAHVVGIYALNKDTSQIFYAKHHPAPQRTWVGLTDEEKSGKRPLENGLLFNSAEAQAWEIAVDYAEAKLKEKNNGKAE